MEVYEYGKLDRYMTEKKVNGKYEQEIRYIDQAR